MAVVNGDEYIAVIDGARVPRQSVISGVDIGNYKNPVVLGTDGKIDTSLVSVAGGGGLLAANNLSDVANAATSRTNLGINLALYVTKVGSLITPPASNIPANNGEVTFELTDNNNLTIRAKGSDGTVRLIILPLA